MFVLRVLRCAATALRVALIAFRFGYRIICGLRNCSAAVSACRSARKILARWEAEDLQPYVQDPEALARVLHEQGLSEDNKVAFVLPTTYLVGKDGGVLAMREGFLNWDTPEARALIAALKEETVQPTPVP